MFDFNPFSRPVAIIEILLLLVAVAILGLYVGRFMLSSRIRSLRSDIDDNQLKLEKCRQKR
ncbi:hypothetical protein GCM10028819_00060 [Spirosoma humi]